MRHATPSNFSTFGIKGKKFTEPSKTIPDQTMSIRQILSRYASGQPVTMHNQGEPLWDEEAKGINPKTLDLSELHDWTSDLKEQYEKMRDEQKQREMQRQKELEFDEMLKQRMEEMESDGEEASPQ